MYYLYNILFMIKINNTDNWIIFENCSLINQKYLLVFAINIFILIVN